MSKKLCYVVTVSGTLKTFFLPQLKALSNAGFEITVVANDTVGIQKYLDDSIRFVELTIPRGIDVVGMLKSTLNLIRFFKKNKFDYIQYSTPNAAVCSAIAAKIVNCKVRNYHLMGFRYLSETGIKKNFLRFMDKLSCSFSTHIECVSQSNFKIGVEDDIFPYDKADVVWNGSTGGVDLNRFDIRKRIEYRNEIRRKYQLDKSEYVFGFVGRITRDKGINELLSAFSKIENSKLMVIGEEEGLDTLDWKLYLDSKKNNDIIYTGCVEEVEKYFAAMDCLVLPSYREGFGNVVIEAEAMGTPVIVSNIPGPIDAVEANVTALLVEPKNVESLEIAMKRMLLGEITISSEVCFKYVKSHFDSEELARKVVDKRKELLDRL